MKKIFYTFLLISPLLFISSCEEEIQEVYEMEENAYVIIGGITYPLDGASKLVYGSVSSDDGLDSLLALRLSLISSGCSFHPIYSYTCEGGNVVDLYFGSTGSNLLESSSNYPFILDDLGEGETVEVGGCYGGFFLNASNNNIPASYDYSVISACSQISVEDNNFSNCMISGAADLTINSSNSITLSASGSLNNGEDFNIIFSGVPDTISFEENW